MGLKRKFRAKLYNQHLKNYCEVCGVAGSDFNPLDIDHVKTLGSGGTDNDYNCMTLCRAHHTEKGLLAIGGMAAKYPRYLRWLLDNDWYVCELTKKWRHE